MPDPLGRRRATGGALALLLLASLSAQAQAATDPADIAFWKSVDGSSNPAEFEAYLAAFPNGRFAALARIRLETARHGAPAAAPVPATGAPAKAAPTAPAPELKQPAAATLTPVKTAFSILESGVVDVDARGLVSGSNLRVAVVPAAAPDAVADPAAFAATSEPVEPTRIRLHLPLTAVGSSEIRLYYIPQFGSSFTVAARAAISVLPGTPGTTPVSVLTQQAAALGPIGFEARYRDQRLVVEGQVLRAEAHTAEEWRATVGGGIAAVERPYMTLSLGRVGATASRSGAPDEVLCALPADDKDVLRRVAAMARGDAVVVSGNASAWQAAFGASTIIMSPCALAPR